MKIYLFLDYEAKYIVYANNMISACKFFINCMIKDSLKHYEKSLVAIVEDYNKFSRFSILIYKKTYFQKELIEYIQDYNIEEHELKEGKVY